MSNNKDTLIAIILALVCGVLLFLSIMMVKEIGEVPDYTQKKNIQCIDGKLYIVYEYMPFRSTRSPLHDNNGVQFKCESKNDKGHVK